MPPETKNQSYDSVGFESASWFSFLNDCDIRQDIGADYLVIYKETILIIGQAVMLLQIIQTFRIRALDRIAISNIPDQGTFQTFLLPLLSAGGQGFNPLIEDSCDQCKRTDRKDNFPVCMRCFPILKTSHFLPPIKSTYRLDMMPISGSMTDNRITPTIRDKAITSVGSNTARAVFIRLSISS